MRYYEMNIEQRIELLCELYIENYRGDSTVEPVALLGSDVALLNYTNKTIIVSYIKSYTECEEKIKFTLCNNDVLVGYISKMFKVDEIIPFIYDRKMFHVKQLQGGSLCEK